MKLWNTCFAQSGDAPFEKRGSVCIELATDHRTTYGSGGAETLRTVGRQLCAIEFRISELSAFLRDVEEGRFCCAVAGSQIPFSGKPMITCGAELIRDLLGGDVVPSSEKRCELPVNLRREVAKFLDDGIAGEVVVEAKSRRASFPLNQPGAAFD